MSLNYSKILPIAILLVGAGLFIGVAVWGWQVWRGPYEDIPRGAVNNQAVALIDSSEIPRSSVSRRRIAGVWGARDLVSRLPYYIKLDDDGAFELIVFQDQGGAARLYSRGAYSYDAGQGVLSLRPDPRLGEPEAISGVSYGVLTMRPYDIELRAGEDGRMIWLPYGVTGRKDQFHPLFTRSGDKQPVIWGRQ